MERIFQLEDAEKRMGFAAAVRYGDMLWISGMVSWDKTLTPLHPGDMRRQMTEVYEQLRAFLGRFDCGMDSVVRETVFVTDLDAALAHVDARLTFFDKDALPAATWVEVRRLVSPELLIEVECVARLARPAGGR
jgi:2-iminobutanoate/2-iminopropanoate deaminase